MEGYNFTDLFIWIYFFGGLFFAGHVLREKKKFSDMGIIGRSCVVLWTPMFLINKMLVRIRNG